MLSGDFVFRGYILLPFVFDRSQNKTQGIFLALLKKIGACLIAIV
jgi:hypothetical protein